MRGKKNDNQRETGNLINIHIRAHKSLLIYGVYVTNTSQVFFKKTPLIIFATQRCILTNNYSFNAS
jgi:hypothetical protein